MYANIPAPFHPALATLLPALAASMAFRNSIHFPYY
jgi:hypothetical protein